MLIDLHFGLKTRPSACKTVIFSSVPNDLNFDFFVFLALLERFEAELLTLIGCTCNIPESEDKSLGIMKIYFKKNDKIATPTFLRGKM